jgi:hypothetical protein
MATIDPNIALGVKPIQIENPMNQYAALSQLESSQQANQLNALKMQQTQQEIADVNALRGKDINDPNFISEVGKINPKLAFEYQAKLATTRAQQIKSQKDAQDLMAQMRRDISRSPTDANITAHTEDFVSSGLFTPQQIAAAQNTRDQLLAMPLQDRQAFLASQGATAGDLKPVLKDTDYGGGVLTRALDPYSGAPTNISNIKKTPTPGDLMVDARARDRLNAELESTGSFTPASLDLAANLLIQTGQLPNLGMGKNAGVLKTKIYNRATELYGNPNSNNPNATTTSSTPFNAADMASTIVGNKIDTATKTKVNKDFSTGIQGRQVTAFNTAIDHLSTMEKLADALQNKDTRAINLLSNTIAKQTGEPAPTNFDAARRIVAAEIVKAIVASGGGVEERKAAADDFLNTSSPAQLKGVINTKKQLLGGQLNSLGLQYEQGTGRTDFDKKLTSDAKAEFQKIRGKHNESNTRLPPGVGTDWTLKTDAKGNKAYVSPDNSKFVEVK